MMTCHRLGTKPERGVRRLVTGRLHRLKCVTVAYIIDLEGMKGTFNRSLRNLMSERIGSRNIA